MEGWKIPGGSLNVYWSKLVGASEKWIQEHAIEKLPFDFLYEISKAKGEGDLFLSLLKETSLVWRESKWFLLSSLYGGEEVYQKFISSCRLQIKKYCGKSWWYKTSHSKSSIKRGMFSPYFVDSNLDIFPSSIYIERKSNINEKRKVNYRVEKSFFCRKVHFTYSEHGNTKENISLFTDTILSTIFFNSELLLSIPDDKPFPIPIIDKICFILNINRSSLISYSIQKNRDSYNKENTKEQTAIKEYSFCNPSFSKTLNIESIATQFFINTDPICNFIFHMNSLPPKKRRTDILFLLKEREKIYSSTSLEKITKNLNEESVDPVFVKSSSSTLFIMKIWMHIFLCYTKCENRFTHDIFSSIFSDFCKQYTKPGSVSHLICNYFSHKDTLEKNPIKKIVDNDPSLMEKIAVSHLTSVLCTDILYWPPYDSSLDLIKKSVYTEDNIWSFSCKTIYEKEDLHKVIKRGSDIYGNYFHKCIKMEENQYATRIFTIIGCSYSHSVVFLDIIQYIFDSSLFGYISSINPPISDKHIKENDNHKSKKINNSNDDDGDDDGGEDDREKHWDKDFVGQDSIHCDDYDGFDIYPKIEDKDPFLFYIQPVPQGSFCSSFIIRFNDHAKHINSFFGISGECSSSISSPENTETFRIHEGGNVNSGNTPKVCNISYPMDFYFSLGKKNNADMLLSHIMIPINDYLVHRYLHLIQIASLWIGFCWSRYYAKKRKHSPLYQNPLFPILGQSISMCNQDINSLLKHSKDGIIQDYFLDIISSQVSIIYKIALGFTQGYHSSIFGKSTPMKVLFSDINAGMMFMYSVPTLWKYCVENKENTKSFINFLQRFIRSLHINPYKEKYHQSLEKNVTKRSPIIITEEDKEIDGEDEDHVIDEEKYSKKYDIKECTQVLVSTHKKIGKKRKRTLDCKEKQDSYEHKPICENVLNIIDLLDLKSITIFQSGPSSFIAKDQDISKNKNNNNNNDNDTKDNSQLNTNHDINEERETENYEIDFVSQSQQSTRFFFDEYSWEQFLEYCIKVLWPSDKKLYECVVMELIEHIYPFEDFAMEKLLHRKRKSFQTIKKYPYLHTKKHIDNSLGICDDEIQGEEGNSKKPNQNATEKMDPYLIIFFIIELCSIDVKQAENFLNFILNTGDQEDLDPQVNEMFDSYKKIFYDSSIKKYDFHIPVESPKIQKENRVRRDGATYQGFPSYFDESLCIPDSLPGQGWQHFGDACPSSLFPDMAYLFGRCSPDINEFKYKSSCEKKRVPNHFWDF